jgi:hypothetical protein
MTQSTEIILRPILALVYRTGEELLVIDREGYVLHTEQQLWQTRVRLVLIDWHCMSVFMRMCRPTHLDPRTARPLHMHARK